MEVVRPHGTFLIMIMILVIAVMLQEEVTDVSTPRTRGAVNNILHTLLFGMLCIYRLIIFVLSFYCSPHYYSCSSQVTILSIGTSYSAIMLSNQVLLRALSPFTFH
jgi:magnesium-transporting ATPase (P-type)